MCSSKFFFQKKSISLYYTRKILLVFDIMMSSLFIDTLSSPAFIGIFDENKNIRDSVSWLGKHAEFDTLTESINTLLVRNALQYSDILGIICIIGPGGFTGIRVTTLVANTLGYSFWIPLYPVTLHEFFLHQKAQNPWILPLTKTEILVWEQSGQISPSILKTHTLDTIKNYSSNQADPPLWDDIKYTQANDYALFLKNYTFSEKVPLLHPIYARDPNVLIKK